MRSNKHLFAITEARDCAQLAILLPAEIFSHSATPCSWNLDWSQDADRVQNGIYNYGVMLSVIMSDPLPSEVGQPLGQSSHDFNLTLGDENYEASEVGLGSWARHQTARTELAVAMLAKAKICHGTVRQDRQGKRLVVARETCNRAKSYEYVGLVSLVCNARWEQNVLIRSLKIYTTIPIAPSTPVRIPYTRYAPSYPRSSMNGVTPYEVPKLGTPLMAQIITSAGTDLVGYASNEYTIPHWLAATKAKYLVCVDRENDRQPVGFVRMRCGLAEEDGGQHTKEDRKAERNEVVLGPVDSIFALGEVPR